MSREWFNISKIYIKYKTEKAYLIYMPKESEYKDLVFWYPSQFIKNKEEEKFISLKFKDTFKFKLINFGKGKRDYYKILNYKIIGVQEFKNVFNSFDKNKVKEKGE